MISYLPASRSAHRQVIHSGALILLNVLALVRQARQVALDIPPFSLAGPAAYEYDPCLTDYPLIASDCVRYWNCLKNPTSMWT